MPSNEEIREKAKHLTDFDDMSPEERNKALDNVDDWIRTFSEEEQAEILEKLRVEAGIPLVDHEALHYLQSLTQRAFDSANVEEGGDVRAIYGFTEEQLQLYASWLDMESMRYDELNQMAQQDAWVTGVLMGLRVGILLQQERPLDG